MFLTIEDLKNEKFSWLQKSDLYLSLLENDNLEITDTYCSVNENNIETYINVVHFWGVYYYPEEFITCLINNKSISIKLLEQLIALTNSEKYNCLLRFLFNFDQEEIVNFSAKNGYLDILTYFSDLEFDFSTCATCARYGHLDCLKYLYENKFLCDEFTCYAAIIGDNLECLKFLIEMKTPFDFEAFLSKNQKENKCSKFLIQYYKKLAILD